MMKPFTLPKPEETVYGNDGWDVISDYSIDLEPLMEGEVKRLIEKYS